MKVIYSEILISKTYENLNLNLVLSFARAAPFHLNAAQS